MRIYIADSGTDQFHSGWMCCLNWALSEIEDDNLKTIKIFRAKPAVKFMRVVAEVTADGVRIITNGRHIRMGKEVKRGTSKT